MLTLKTYTASFVGRKIGAIGGFYRFQTTVTGTDKAQARLNLYKHYEHIEHLQLQEKEHESISTIRKLAL